MSDLEPITRDEMLWSGEDLEPKTRREMYIKHLYDETQVIPEKPITREEMFILKAGEELHDVTIEQLTATENRTYSEEGVAYSPVIVNVPQTTLTTLDVTENGTYTAPSGTAYNEVEVDVPLPENAYLLKDIPNTPTAIATFSDGANLPMAKLEVGIEPVQEGSGDPSPTNIRPIIGWDEVDVTVADDITNKSFFDGLMNGTYGVVDLGSYTYTAVSMSNDRTAYCISIYDLPMNPKYDISSVPNAVCPKFLPTYQTASVWMAGEFVFTGSAGTLPQNSLGFITKTSDYADATTFKQAVNGVHLIYELTTPTTPTVTPSEINELYEEFGINGQTYTIDLDGTRYGGTLDVVSGVLTVEKVELDLGSRTYNKSSDGYFYCFTTDLNFVSFDKDNPDAECEIYKLCTYAEYISKTVDSAIFGNNNSHVIYIADSRFTDVNDLKTALNGVKLVYELATPLTIQLTPTQVSSLLGVNNVWADCGDIIDGQYFGKEV